MRFFMKKYFSCGFTNIGRIANGTQVQLSFSCPDMAGVIAHEVRLEINFKKITIFNNIFKNKLYSKI